MRRIATLAVLVFVAAVAVGAIRPAPAQAASPITIRGAVTDNYKAIWNEDPEVRENRTWLAFDRLEVNGVLYWPTRVPELRDYTTDLAVTGSDGSSAVARVSAGADVVNKPFRNESVGTWGPLLVLKDASTLVDRPVRITITLERNGNVLGSVDVEYRYEDAIYNAPRDSREYNSPGGRFWLGCTPTRLDWQGTSPANNCPEEPNDRYTANGTLCTIVGTAGADVLKGTPSRDVICGLGGNDRLVGGAGDDELDGSDGKDVLEGGAGDDVIHGGAGRDRMSFVSAAAGVVINMTQLPHPAWDGDAAGDANIGWDEVISVEDATGSPFADDIAGRGGVDRLAGAGGNDVIYGYAGADLINGGAGNDKLFGGDGTDSLAGSTGADALNGQASTDTCAGGGQAGDTKLSCER